MKTIHKLSRDVLCVRRTASVTAQQQFATTAKTGADALSDCLDDLRRLCDRRRECRHVNRKFIFEPHAPCLSVAKSLPA
jgi:hypothetical protein